MATFSQLVYALALMLFALPGVTLAEDTETAQLREIGAPVYYWRNLNVSERAVVSTLFCHATALSPESIESKDASVPPRDIPLIAVLRDTLGYSKPEDARLSYVWLLTYERPSLGQRILSAIPFFYWHMDEGPNSARQLHATPLLDLATPEHPMLSDFRHDLMQWTTLDPSITAIRATSRTYRTNEVDHERLHLEEAVSYLRKAPTSDGGNGLTLTQVNTVIARLELRKKLLGGFVNQRRATHLGEQVAFQQQQIRMRNWELLRQCAEKTGLVFQPLAVGATSGEYAMLSLPAGEAGEPVGTSLASVWRLLGISDPWHDSGLHTQPGPLAVYSLNYAKAPLLLMDFRNKERVRWHEMTQRSINELTAGIIGISHFTNWYYYIGADLYNFYVGRHGAAIDQAARLDCYAQFRVELATDTHLDPNLRAEMQERIESLEINPLESNPGRELAAAWARYSQLEQQARANGPLLERIEKDRRQELASRRESSTSAAWDRVLHELTFGAYTHRAKAAPEDLRDLVLYRQIDSDLAFLDSLVKTGTRPEVAYNTSMIEMSVTELGDLMREVNSPAVLAHAKGTLENLQQLSFDAGVQADCSQAVASLRTVNTGASSGGSSSALGLSLSLSLSEEMRRP